MKFITILCTRSATHLMRGTREGGGRVPAGCPGCRARPFTQAIQCASLSFHDAGERARETGTLSLATKGQG